MDNFCHNHDMCYHIIIKNKLLVHIKVMVYLTFTNHNRIYYQVITKYINASSKKMYINAE